MPSTTRRAITVVEWVVLVGVSLLIYVGLYLFVNHYDYFHSHYSQEDGLIEWATFGVLAGGGVVVLRRVVRLGREKGTLFFLCTACLSMLFLLAACEEISWGQRIFGIESPEYFREHNRQGETNLHNLTIGSVNIGRLAIPALQIMAPVYLLVVPFLYRRIQWCQAALAKLAVPLPRIQHQIWFLHIVSLLYAFTGPGIFEMYELMLATLGLLIVWNPLNSEIYTVSGDRVAKTPPDRRGEPSGSAAGVD